MNNINQGLPLRQALIFFIVQDAIRQEETATMISTHLCPDT